jgi:hypothetical protein
MTFDEDLKGILDSYWDETVIDKPKIVLAREVRMVDLQSGNFVIIEPAHREDEFFGIGAVDYLVRARCSLTIKAGGSVDDANKMLSVVQGILRDKSKWSSWMNVRISSLESLMDREKKIYSYALEVEAIKVESVA